MFKNGVEDSEGRLASMQVHGVDWIPVAVLIGGICLVGWIFIVCGKLF